MRYEYLHLKASYYLIFRDKDLSRATLYKLDRQIRERDEDFRQRTAYQALMAKFDC